ncbi:hypothetical protein G5I_11277 [Acromyrmex echinatior]|uniref:Uncharacterized protein n=1 Tax=Acromyrmex echinatior TaxID=103372 RepID=F4WZ65_ACREC|nr:hypothetical protein G5I_11277 [Acromyrmex echinatior]
MHPITNAECGGIRGKFLSNLPYEALIEFKRLMIPYTYTQCSHVPNRSTTPDRTLEYICMKGDNTTRARRKIFLTQRDESHSLGDINLIAATTMANQEARYLLLRPLNANLVSQQNATVEHDVYFSIAAGDDDEEDVDTHRDSRFYMLLTNSTHASVPFLHEALSTER